MISNRNLSPSTMLFGLIILVLLHHPFIMTAQTIYATIPKSIQTDHNYVFYLHGAIVQQQGANAVSEQHGAYEYQHIVESLAALNYQVISEVRPKNAQIDTYAKKIANEIKALLDRGVTANKITVVGASLGAYMAVEAAYILQNNTIGYALLGMCSDYAFNYFANHQGDLCGNFYSIYEISDGPGSCKPLLVDKTCNNAFEELALNMGNGHGFLYKPYPEWVRPLSTWINTR